MDYKFYKTRIVNLTIEYNCIQLQASSSVFKKDILKGKSFKEEVSFSEDTRLINNILLINPIMGVVKEAKYYYRKRNDFSSALQNKQNSLNFYFEAIYSVFGYLINTSISLYNKIVPFIQFLIGYEFLFRIQSLSYKYLDSNNFKKYIFLIEDIIKQIEDKYILEQRILSYKYKIFLLSKKYHKDLRNEIKFENNSLIYLNHILINFNNEQSIVSLKILELQNDKLYIKATDNLWMKKENYFYFCKIGNKTIFPKYVENSNDNFFTLYGLTEKGRIIIFEIPIKLSNETLILYFYLSYLNNNIEIFPSLGFFTHIPDINNGYYIIDKYIIKYIEKHLLIFKYYKKLEISSEKLYSYELKKAKKFNLIKLRKKYFKHRNKVKNDKAAEIWLINDEIDRAGSNGEYFFRYLKFKNPDFIKPYFVILKNCSDYKRLKKLEGIVDIYSNSYKKLFLRSNKIISSVYNSWAFNPFKKNHKYIRDLFHFDIIFIQNGILKDDFSKYISKIDKNFYLITTSSKREYKEILKINYGYNDCDIILTGMPRFDNLYRLKKVINIERKILIIPTWRKYIKNSRDLISYENRYSNIFKFTKFFKFYNELINDKKLLFNMKHYNFTGIFCLHPFFKSQWIDFQKNELFSINENCNYQELLLKSFLLITDYSNIFFDFGYLAKPIIYTHFDYANYRTEHYKEGYFDYNKFGFGPICKDIQCTIREIIFELENNCLLRKKYLKRIKKFFAYFDDNNSKRVFQEILKAKEKVIRNGNNSKILFLILIIIIFSFVLIKIDNIFKKMKKI